MNDLTTSITWTSVESGELPDDDIDVLLALEDGDVCSGYYGSGIWRNIASRRFTKKVMYWANYPEHPEIQSEPMSGMLII